MTIRPGQECQGEPPPPLACGICPREVGWDWDEQDQEWTPAREWWHTPDHPYLCGRHCWLKATGHKPCGCRTPADGPPITDLPQP